MEQTVDSTTHEVVCVDPIQSKDLCQEENVPLGDLDSESTLESFTLFNNSLINGHGEKKQKTELAESISTEKSSVREAPHSSVSDDSLASEIETQAADVVNQVLDTASLSLGSSGDFSMLKDAAVSQKKHNDSVQTKNDSKIDLNSNEQDSNDASPDKESDWLDILGNNLLRKKIVLPGAGRDSRPQRGQEVTIAFSSRLIDGSIAEDPQNLTFILQDQEVPSSIDMTVNLMEKGEKCELISDAKYCYGTQGKPPSIPPNSQLTYNIELLDVQEGPYSTECPVEKRLQWVDAKRSHGNRLYSSGKYEDAVSAYHKCTRVLQQASNQDQGDDVMSQIETFSIKCHNNLSASQIKLKKWKEALQACSIAEMLDPTNVKTLFRKGKILAELGNTSKSVAALKRALELSPDDKTVQNELNRQQKRLLSQNKAQKKMYQRMIGGTKKKEQADSVIGAKKDSFWKVNSKMWVGSSLVVVGVAVLLGVYLSR